MNKPVGSRFGQPGKSDIISKFRTGKFRPGIVLNICTNQKWNTNFRSEHSHRDKQPPTFKPTLQLFPPNRPFYRYGSHIEFIRFKEYYGMPRGHSLSIYARFLGKKRTYCIFLGKKAIIIKSKHGTTSFFPITIFFWENLKKNWPEKRT